MPPHGACQTRLVRILIVDDERAFADVLAKGLTAEGYVVDTAHDGRSGYLLAATGAYAAVILDLMLPGMSGFTISARLRREGVMTPVLVLTAKDGQWDEVEALDSGADDYLRKPFSYSVLTARIRSLLRRPAEALDGTLRVGDVTVDVAHRQVRRADRAIALSGLEFALVELLARADGAVVSKEAILLELWPGEQSDVNLVEARVSALRRKLDAPDRPPAIHTIRGGGYRLATGVDRAWASPARASEPQ